MMRRWTLGVVVAVLLMTTALALGGPKIRASAGEIGDPVIAAAGDIACPAADPRTDVTCNQADTAALLKAKRYTAILPIGDNQYDCGQLSEFQASYDPTWGSMIHLMRPVPGDNDYFGSTCTTPGASGYFQYFEKRATPLQPDCTIACGGYYSYNLGAWHLIALNSECTQDGVGGCDAASPQVQWLRADLAAHPNQCVLAYWHQAYFANARINPASTSLMQAVFDAGVDVVLSGHNHYYARFAPSNPSAELDPNGPRQFTVGTGGKSHGVIRFPTLPNFETGNDQTFGIQQLSLHPTSYDWTFIPEAGQTFTDSGSQSCHHPATSS